MQALRRTQQRLLLKVIERAGSGDALAAVDTVTAEMGLTGYTQALELEQAMLDVWALSEGSNHERLAA